MTGTIIVSIGISCFSIAAYNLAGLRAAETCDGPGSFQVAFLNALYNLTTEEVTEAPLALTSTSAA